jgi:hypothetical protein
MSNPGPASTTTIHPSNLASNQAIRLLGVATGVSVSALGDEAVIQINNSTNYSVSNVIFTNASASLTSAEAGLFTAPSAGGTAIVADAALSALTSAAVVSQRTVATTNTQSAQNLYVNVSAVQAGTVTMDVYVYGYDLSVYS